MVDRAAAGPPAGRGGKAAPRGEGAADGLTDHGSFALLDQLLREMEAEVSVLVNCRRFRQDRANYAAVGADDSVNAVNLNCSAAVRSRSPACRTRKAGGHIIQLLLDGRLSAAATDQCLQRDESLSLRSTQALHAGLLPPENRGAGRLPYWVKDTEFIGIAEKEKDRRRRG